jgi:class 3 adenylate cyclase
LSLQQICPVCKTLNEAGRRTCIACTGALSGDAVANPNTSPQKRDAGVPQERLLSLNSAEGRVIRISNGDVVGRTAVGREFLEIHEEISRRHAEFILSEGNWFVVDLNSSNGTFLDGKQIPPRERFPLRDGQRIRLSPVFEAEINIRGGLNEEEAAAVHDEAAGPHDPRRTVVILFADLKGSVDFFQEKGTIIARNWILQLYRMLSSAINAHGGTHIKNIGDAILAVFDDPHEAARASVEMQSDLRTHNRTVDETGRYYLRIGMNKGPVLFEDRDIFGNAVNIASRVQAIAPPEHIFITEDLYEAIRNDKDIQCRFIGLEQLKGVREKTRIYEILSEDKRNTDCISKPLKENPWNP